MVNASSATVAAASSSTKGLGADPGTLIALCQNDPEASGLLQQHRIE